MIIKWNLTSELNKYKNGDIIVLSIGKSGRTWLRVLINKYLSLHYNIPFTFDLSGLHNFNRSIPAIYYSHEIWIHYSDATLLQYIFGKYVIPDSLFNKKKILLLSRDPRDIVISLYFQKTKRARKRLNIDITNFIRHKKYGIYNIVKVLNIWNKRLNGHPEYLLTRYEDLKQDTLKELIYILSFMGIKEVDINKAKDAVVFSEFNNMRRMENRGEFITRKLRPTNSADPDTYKVREGKVGGYMIHCLEEDQRYLSDALKKLNTRYKYIPI